MRYLRSTEPEDEFSSDREASMHPEIYGNEYFVACVLGGRAGEVGSAGKFWLFVV